MDNARASVQATCARLASRLLVGVATLWPAMHASADVLSPDYIQGTWAFDRLAGDGHTGTLTFLPNGVYVHMETGPAERTGFPGMEVGTYTFTPLTATSGHLTTTPIKDTNGDWGPGVLSADISFQVSNGMKCIPIDDPTVNPAHFSACTANTTTPIGLTHGWFAGSGPGNILVLDFLPNGVYLEGIDPMSFSFETGLYTIDGTGLLTLSNVARTGSDPTLSQLGPVHATVVGNQLQVQSNQSTVDLAAVPLTPAIPEPPVQLLMLLGLGSMAAASKVRSVTSAGRR